MPTSILAYDIPSFGPPPFQGGILAVSEHQQGGILEELASFHDFLAHQLWLSFVVAHAGFEPAISSLRGRCPKPLDECALFIQPGMQLYNQRLLSAITF